MKKWDLRMFVLLPALVVFGLLACRQEASTEQSNPSQPTSAVDRAAQRTVDAIKTPMDKARSVEGTLEQAAGRTAEQIQGATP
jgi:outer membrane biogenesis lipoprotein LolB